MLAIARGVLTNPRVLLLDEPTEGLAPLMVSSVTQAIVNINKAGIPILLVEQNLKIPLKIAHRQYVIENGMIVWEGTSAELLKDKKTVESYISL